MDNETEAVEFLDRLDLDVNDFESKKIFEEKLFQVFQSSGQPIATQKQVNALFEIGNTQFLDFPSNNITRIEFERGGKTQTRFTLPNARGLFNFQSALKFLRGK